jgi:hypothetical protein
MGELLVIKKMLIGAVAGTAVLAMPAAAFADSCANVSRPAPAGYTATTTYSAPLVQGNWVWLPSLPFTGAAGLPPLWGFITPGTADSQLLQAPGAGGNYTNGQTVSLLGVSVLCQTGSQAFVIRQTSHGIQSGCE